MSANYQPSPDAAAQTLQIRERKELVEKLVLTLTKQNTRNVKEIAFR